LLQRIAPLGGTPPGKDYKQSQVNRAIKFEVVSFDLATLNPRTIKISTSQGEEQTINLVPGQVKHVEHCDRSVGVDS
jgi:hypothetical protein